jgi:hypothetical protein
MKTALRNVSLTLGATLALAACSNDSRSAEDVLAEDSTLALEVMSANQDTLPIQVDSDTSAGEPQIAEPAQAPAPTVEPSPSPPVIAKQAPQSPATRRRSSRRSSPARVKNPRSIVRSASTRPSTRSAARTPEHPRVEATPMKSSAMIPAGTELSLTSGQRICASMSNPGDRFTARLAEDVMGPIGVIIPKGSEATAQIFSLEKSVDLTMESITLGGNTYSIDADVTHTEIEKVTRKPRASKSRVAAGAGIGAVTGGVIGGSVPGAVIGAAGGALAGAVTSRRSPRADHCVPEGGQITVRLTEPLKLTLSE